MFGKAKNFDNLSVEEMERLLKVKQREARKDRFLRLSKAGVSKNAALLNTYEAQLTLPETPSNSKPQPAPQKPKSTRDRILGLIEIIAVVGLITILWLSYQSLQTLNAETAASLAETVAALPTHPNPAPIEAQAAALPFDRLPGGHTSPTSQGGAMPDIPAHLQNWVQPQSDTTVQVSAQSAAIATRIVIPKLDVDAPIIAGVTWEDLKKGVGHLPGSAQPGERGNLYLAAHNDIFGELFRYLDKLEAGDRYYIYAGATKYTYEVREKRIIDPTDVEVMLPTTGPVATLQSCYPYLIDTHRIVVVADLVE